jgi:branched-chain amino acid transport system permease protein
MRAVACDKEAAQAVGININLISATTFSVGTSLAALAGVLLGSLFYVNTTMGAMPVLKAFVIIIIGGKANIMGAIFGGFLLGVGESIGTGYFSAHYKDSFAFAILIVYLLLRPRLQHFRIKCMKKGELGYFEG